MSRRMRFTVLAAISMGVFPAGVSGQLAQRIAALDEGTVRFSYATRPGVEICDQGIRVGQDHMWWRSRHGDEPQNCRVGIAEVEIQVRRGLVRDVEIVRGLDDRNPDARNFGEVTPSEATEYLLSLAYAGATGEGAEDAILPAMLADVDGTWEKLLTMAKDVALEEEIRKSTLFWLGQEAATAATDGLSEVALDGEEDQEIRNSAIFALSQRPPREAVPALIEVARSGEQAETRRTAMFWLAQSGDERVVDFFEEVLLGRVR